MSLDLYWDGETESVDVAGRRLPARPAFSGADADGSTWWALGIPLENAAALLLIVDLDDAGVAESALVQLLLPAPGSAWTERLESLPCIVDTGRIRPVLPEGDVPEPFDGLLTDGWWAHLDEAEEILRYASMFGTMPVVGTPMRV